MYRTAVFRRLALIVALFFSCVSGLQNDRTVKFDDASRYTVLANFGFDDGGRADVKADSDSLGNFLFFMCPSTTYFARVMLMSPDDTCLKVQSGELDVPAVNFFNKSLDLSFTSEQKETYFAVLVSCTQGSFTVQTSVYAVNPGGDLLGYGFRPFQPLYAVCLVAWVLGTAAWTGHLVYFRLYVTKLHMVLMGWPLVRVITSIVGLIEWTLAAKVGEVSQGSGTASGVVAVIASVWYWITLMLLATGFCITHPSLSKENRIYFGVTTALFIGSVVAVVVYPGIATVVIYVLVDIALIVVLFRRIVITRRSINSELASDPHGGRQVTTASTVWNAPLKARARAMTHFLWIMIGYMVVSFVIIILSSVAIIGYYWLPAFMGEALAALLFIFLGVAFRLRNPQAYMSFEASEPGDVPFNNL
eukprot:TRINITY_DN9140_c0_g1_i1.p1 TRINITY_DN9140_c0_g1~~TRINITY_DN9140_c0_g1_i1.p1  ORF type:complete len:452 (+),score=126.22 TRINITY_DN9140_c0_g1_i1:103-1356(+)